MRVLRAAAEGVLWCWCHVGIGGEGCSDLAVCGCWCRVGSAGLRDSLQASVGYLKRPEARAVVSQWLWLVRRQREIETFKGLVSPRPSPIYFCAAGVVRHLQGPSKDRPRN